MLNMQNVKDIEITEGDVRTIHDRDNRLIWGRLAYDTKYAGNTLQNGTPTLTTPINVDVVTGTQTVTIVASYGLYQGSTYTLNLAGDNLFDVSKVINNSPSLINNGDGTLTVTAYGTQGTAPNTLSVYCPTLQVGDEVILSADTTSTNKFVYLAGTNTQWNFGDKRKILASDLTSRVLWYSDNATTPATISNIKIVKPIELCKIGDYQDYIYKDGDDWYLHKETGKEVLDGTGISWSVTSNNGLYAFYKTSDEMGFTPKICDYFEYVNTGWRNITQPTLCENTAGSTKLLIFAGFSDITTTADWETWLSTHNTSVYYALATATDTKITDSTLIGQLDAIHQFLTRYGYNSNVTGNLPIIINQTSL